MKHTTVSMLFSSPFIEELGFEFGGYFARHVAGIINREIVFLEEQINGDDITVAWQNAFAERKNSLRTVCVAKTAHDLVIKVETNAYVFSENEKSELLRAVEAYLLRRMMGREEIPPKVTIQINFYYTTAESVEGVVWPPAAEATPLPSATLSPVEEHPVAPASS